MNSIDIIIPVYNGERFIAEAINSILTQTWKDFRIIVVDDGSTDNTASLIKEIQKSDERVNLLQPGRQGLPKTTNAGLRFSNAPFIAFLDADDLWEPTKLEKQMKVLNDQKDVIACFTQIKEFETFQNTSAKQTFTAREKAMNGVAKLSFLGRRSLFEQFGYFDEHTTTGDFLLWFSPVIHSVVRYVIIPEVLAYRRIHDNNMTRTIDTKDYLKVIKAHLDAKKRNEI